MEKTQCLQQDYNTLEQKKRLDGLGWWFFVYLRDGMSLLFQGKIKMDIHFYTLSLLCSNCKQSDVMSQQFSRSTCPPKKQLYILANDFNLSTSQKAIFWLFQNKACLTKFMNEPKRIWEINDPNCKQSDVTSQCFRRRTSAKKPTLSCCDWFSIFLKSKSYFLMISEQSLFDKIYGAAKSYLFAWSH